LVEQAAGMTPIGKYRLLENIKMNIDPGLSMPIE
jgi:hypothetical protein